MGAFVANEAGHRHIDFGDAIPPPRAIPLAGCATAPINVSVVVSNPSRTADVEAASSAPCGGSRTRGPPAYRRAEVVKRRGVPTLAHAGRDRALNSPR